MELSLPLPDTTLLSHPHGSWKGKWPRVREARQRACAEALAAHRRDAPVDPAEMALTFHFPDNRTRDLLNYAHAAKPYIDGLVDAGWIVDDAWQHLSVTVAGRIDRQNPRMVVEVSRARP